jgi:hypothetical protein
MSAPPSRRMTVLPAARRPTAMVLRRGPVCRSAPSPGRTGRPAYGAAIRSRSGRGSRAASRPIRLRTGNGASRSAPGASTPGRPRPGSLLHGRGGAACEVPVGAAGAASCGTIGSPSTTPARTSQPGHRGARHPRAKFAANGCRLVPWPEDAFIFGDAQRRQAADWRVGVSGCDLDLSGGNGVLIASGCPVRIAPAAAGCRSGAELLARAAPLADLAFRTMPGPGEGRRPSLAAMGVPWRRPAISLPLRAVPDVGRAGRRNGTCAGSGGVLWRRSRRSTRPCCPGAPWRWS